MTYEISNDADSIDIRDVIARIEDLAQLEQPGPVECGGVDDADKAQDALFDELRRLRSLMDECKGNGGDEQYEGDWYPVTLIRDSYFKDYAQDLAEEGGMIPADAKWPCSCIDWDQAARELRMDYTAVDFGGVTYWVR